MSDPSTPPVNRTLLIALAAVVGIAVLFLLVIQPLLLSGDDDDLVIEPPVRATPAPSGLPGSPAPLPSGSVSPAPPPEETFEVFSARDPFQQLVVAAAEGDPGATGTPGATPGPGATGTPAPGTSPGPGGGGTPTPAPTLPGPGQTVQDTRVELIDVITDDDGQPAAIIEVDGTRYEVNEGEDFADDVELVDINGLCTELTVDGQTVLLCEAGATPPQPTPSPSPSPGASPRPTGSPRPGESPRPGDPPPDTRVGATQVELVDVFTDDDDRPAATVVVNGRGYTVNEGETFAERFRLLDISGQCATFLFGDSRFTLCEGEEIRK